VLAADQLIGKAVLAVLAAGQEENTPTLALVARTAEMAAPETFLAAPGRARQRQPLALAAEPSIPAAAAAAPISGWVPCMAAQEETTVAEVVAARTLQLGLVD